MGTKDAYDKLIALQKFATVQNAGERSFGALQTASTVVPQSNMSREAIINILAGQFRDKQIALDADRYLADYKNLFSTRGGTEGAYLAQSADRLIRQKLNSDFYAQEEEAFKKLLKQPGIANVLFGGGKFNPEFLDRYSAERLNSPMLRRWLENQ
jgi:hypothetical protein